MNTYFNTIIAALNYLADKGYPAQLYPCADGWMLKFPWYEEGDIACNSHTGGQLESFGFSWDDGDITRDSLEGFHGRLAKLWQEVTY